MMKNFIKKHKQQTIVAASILILLVVTIGTSFAFFNYAKKGTTENSIKLGEITFKYTENGTNGNGITITDAFPISDEEGKTKTDKGNYFDFKVEANSTRSNIEYEVVAEPTKNNTLPLDAIKFYLTELNNSEETVIDSCLNADGTVKTLDKFINTTITGQTGKTIYQETILTNTKGYLKQFRARMWIRDGLDISDEKYENKSGQIRVNVYANADRSTAATDTTTPEDTRVERVTANNKYLFTAVTNEKYQYELVVPNEIDNVDISVITTNMSAKTSITPTELLTRSQIYSLAVGENFFKATVTSDDGTKKQDYVLKVTREKSSNTGLNSLTVGNYELKPSYSDNNDIYEVQVPNEITSVDVNTVAKESTQTIKGTGTYNLNVGSNEVIVNVTSENGTVRTIRINVIRKLPNDASINNVGVNNYTLNHLEGNIYTVEVPYGVGEIEIANISTTGANVTGIGKKQLNVGNNDFEVTVTSASGETTIKYIIRVIRQKDTNNDLKNLNLSNCTISPQFDKDTLEYTCEVENNVAETIITAEPLSNAAKVVGIGKKTLAYGVNTFKVTVTAQNGETKTYTITVTRKASSDATLKSLTVSSGTLTPEFVSSKTEYTVSVPYSVSTITIGATVNNSEATVTGTGDKELVVGENKIEITVTAQNRDTKTYTITVTREKDTDNTLKSLSLTNCTLSPTFNGNTTSYTCTVENNVTETTVTAIA
ncbi:MAG: cadherin-like beta sandwich domain-containing protein, partial [Tenericutes bacterium]|nr:cadherin-like beta sandwich domain-containing protein [Mycoplasmatota bacterium]